jgi:thiamine biosynthesis lipoprotein
MLDLGSIGKGYAVDRAVEILREAGITQALVQGGTSTVYGLGSPPNLDGWGIAAEHPAQSATAGTMQPNDAVPKALTADDPNASLLCVVSLKDEALSVSAVWGKSFEADGRIFGHVMDPRAGCPVMGSLLSVVASTSAMDTDALSTALLVLGAEGLGRVAQFGTSRALVMTQDTNGAPRVATHGIEVRGTMPTNPSMAHPFSVTVLR